MEEFKLDLTDKVAHIEESVKSAHKRIDAMESLTKSVYELAASIKAMQHDITDMSGRLRTMEEKPGKRWDLVIASLITGVVGALIGFLLRF